MPVLHAAEAVGIRRVALLSVLGAGRNPLLPHRTVERRLERTAFDVALLRAAYFMQNLSEVHDGEVREGRLEVPAGAGATSMVDARDVGDVAAVWLASGAPGQRALDLTGPEALTMFEVTRVLSELLGRRVGDLRSVRGLRDGGSREQNGPRLRGRRGGLLSHIEARTAQGAK